MNRNRIAALLLIAGLAPAVRAQAFSPTTELDALNSMLASPSQTFRQGKKEKGPSAINRRTRKIIAEREAVRESVLTRWPLQALALLFSPAGCGTVDGKTQELCPPEKIKVTDEICTPLNYRGFDGFDGVFGGERGDDGEDGQDLYVTAKIYDSPPAADGSVSKILYVDVAPMFRPDAVLQAALPYPLAPNELIHIYSMGGSGGNGADGTCSTRGGDGGDGGRGGYVQLFYNDPAVLDLLDIHLHGGSGGYGGYAAAGCGGTTYRGYDGRRGMPGAVTLTPQP